MTTLEAILPKVRGTFYALIILLSISVFGLSANFLSLTRTHLDGYFYFTPLSLSVSGVSWISLTTFFIIGILRRNAVTSLVFFDLGWTSFLCIAWWATAGYTQWSTTAFPAGCIYGGRGIDWLNDLCIQVRAIADIAFVIAAILLLYGAIVFAIAFKLASNGTPVWKSDITTLRSAQETVTYSTQQVNHSYGPGTTVPPASFIGSATQSPTVYPQTPLDYSKPQEYSPYLQSQGAYSPYQQPQSGLGLQGQAPLYQNYQPGAQPGHYPQPQS